jgi:hypothetical protein
VTPAVSPQNIPQSETRSVVLTGGGLLCLYSQQLGRGSVVLTGAWLYRLQY